MNKGLAVLFALVLAIGAPPVRGETSSSPNDEFAGQIAPIAEALNERADCLFGGKKRVGIWPLDADRLPMAPESAAQVYGAILADLIRQKPDCVDFFDGAGAGATLEYLNITGELRMTDSTARQDIEQAFRDVDFIISIAINERAGAIVAALKLTDPGGETIATTPAFDLPEAYVSRGCGAGAVPLETALTRAAESLVETAHDMTQLVSAGGFYADTEERTSFAGYAEPRLIGALARAYENPITGKRLLIADGAAEAGDGAYTLSFRYWPCPSEERLVLSAQMRGAAGQTAGWDGAVTVASLPDGIEIAPAPEVDEFWSLSVTPSRAEVGDELALVAEVPRRCSPVFVDFSPSGKAAMIPQSFFVTQDLDDGSRQFRVDASTRYGLSILPEDEKGHHQLGFFCKADSESASAELLRGVWMEVTGGDERQITDKERRNYWFERYEVR